MISLALPRVKTPTPGYMKFKILVEGCLVFITMNSVFHIDMQK